VFGDRVSDLRERLTAEVLGSYEVPRWGVVAAAAVMKSFARPGQAVDVVPADAVVGHGRIVEVRRYKEPLAEVGAGLQCGITVEGIESYLIGDAIVGASDDDIR
jgi:translation initiation factor IF-2